jgi:hypothetical protein
VIVRCSRSSLHSSPSGATVKRKLMPSRSPRLIDSFKSRAYWVAGNSALKAKPVASSAKWIGLDVGGGERSHTAVVWTTEDLRVGAKILSGDEGVLEAGEWIRELASTYVVAELAFDPWNAKMLAAELEREGMLCVEFPQANPRLVPSSRGLYQAVVEGRVTHANDRALNQHVAAAIARDTPRGWRLDRPDRSTPIDGVIALAMCVARAEVKPEPVRLLGWL